jgi:myo-inositol-1-phosphate synthase
LGGRRIPPEPIIYDDHALIELTRGCYAKIDLEDVEKVAQYIWSTQIKKHLKYAVTARKNGKPGQMFLHQYIMDFPGQDIDHIDGDGLNNRKDNLRTASQQQNQANQRIRTNSSSRYKGVCQPSQAKTWVAAISVHGTVKYLGSFPTEKLAAAAYNEAALEYRGSYALTNVIEEDI